MIRQFITVSGKGEVLRHETAEEATALISSGVAVAVIEISPKEARAQVRVYELDEEGYHMAEIK